MPNDYSLRDAWDEAEDESLKKWWHFDPSDVVTEPPKAVGGALVGTAQNVAEVGRHAIRTLQMGDPSGAGTLVNFFRNDPMPGSVGHSVDSMREFQDDLPLNFAGDLARHAITTDEEVRKATLRENRQLGIGFTENLWLSKEATANLVTPDTILGGLGESIGQFVIPFSKVKQGAGVLKSTQALKGWSGLGRSSKLARRGKFLAENMVTGAASDMVAFASTDGRLANLGASLGWDHWIIRALQSEGEEEKFWEGRLSNAAEGLVLGPFVDLLRLAIRHAKHGRRVKKVAEVSAEGAEQLKERGSVPLSDADDAALRGIDPARRAGRMRSVEEGIITPEKALELEKLDSKLTGPNRKKFIKEVSDILGEEVASNAARQFDANATQLAYSMGVSIDNARGMMVDSVIKGAKERVRDMVQADYMEANLNVLNRAARQQDLDKPTDQNLFDRQSGQTPARTLVRDNAERSDQFRENLIRVKQGHKWGWSVTPKDPGFYKNPKTKLFMSDDGSAGVAVAPDGNLVSAYKMPDSEADVDELFREASQFASHATYFSTGQGLTGEAPLTTLGKRYGFTEVSRVEFIDSFQRNQPEGWNYEGYPATIFAVRDPENLLGLEGVEGKVYRDYDEAWRAQKTALNTLRDWSTREPVRTLYQPAAPERALPPNVSVGLAIQRGVIADPPIAKSGRGNKATALFDIYDYFDNSFVARFGRRGDFDNPEDVARATDMLEAEVLETVQQAHSGRGWYDDDVAKAWKLTEEHIPELKTRPALKILGTAIAGIMSNGTDVPKNWEYMTIALRSFIKSEKKAADGIGVIPNSNPQGGGGGGWSGPRSPTMFQQINLLNEIIRDLGSPEAAVDWLTQMHPVKELERVLRESDSYSATATIKAPPGETMLLGFDVIGPKLGLFAASVHGWDIRAVIDRWSNRTSRRMFGQNRTGAIDQDTKINDAPTDVERELFQNMFQDVADRTGMDVRDVQAISWTNEQRLVSKLGVTSVPNLFSEGARRVLAANKIDPNSVDLTNVNVAQRGDVSLNAAYAGPQPLLNRRALLPRSRRRVWHLSLEDLRKKGGILRKHAAGGTADARDRRRGTGNAGTEVEGYKYRKDGTLDASSATIFGYLPGGTWDTNVTGRAAHLIEGNYAFLRVGSDHWKRMRKVAEQRLKITNKPYSDADIGREIRKLARNASYDAIENVEIGHVQFVRDIKPKEIKAVMDLASTKDMTIEGRNAVQALQKIKPWTVEGPRGKKMTERTPLATLAQDDRGKVEIFEDSGAIITLFENADPTTIMHELSHVFRHHLQDIDPALLTKAERWVGARIGQEWTMEMEEKWAAAFEKYLLEGVAPTKDLEDTFATYRSWAKDVYADMRGQHYIGKVHLDNEIREVFDTLFGKNYDPAAVSRALKHAKAKEGQEPTRVNRGINAAQEMTKPKPIRELYQEGVDAGLSPLESRDEAVKFHINHARNDVDIDIERILRDVEEVQQKVIDDEVGKKQSLAEAKELAEEYGGSEDDIFNMLASDLEHIKGQSIRMLVGRILRNGLARKLHETAEQIVQITAAGGDLKQATRQFEAIEARVGLADALVGAIQKEGARIPSFGRVIVGENHFDDAGTEALVQLLRNAEADPANAALRKVIASSLARGENELAEALGGYNRKGHRRIEVSARAIIDAAKVGREGQVASRLLKESKKGADAFDMYLEFWKASLLSGMKTWGINIASGGIKTQIQALERLFGSFTTLNPKEIKSSFRFIVNLAGVQLDVVKMLALAGGEDGFGVFRGLGQTIKNEIPHLTGVTATESRQAIRGKNFGLTGKPEKAVDVAGRIIRSPFLINALGEEFWSQINYRAYMRTLAADAADEKIWNNPTIPSNKKSAAAAEFIDEYIKDGFDGSGRAAGNKTGGYLHPDAVQYARSVNFMQALEYGIGETLQSAAKKHRGLQLILPFITAPVNLVRTSIRYTPGIGQAYYFGSSGKHAVSEVDRQRQVGEMIVGNALWVYGIWLAITGQTTGGGPTNPEERRVLLQSGWQPYSFQTDNDDGTKSFIQYSRFDPLASIFGLSADLTEAFGPGSTKEMEGVTEKLMKSLADNFASKTYMRSVSEGLRAMMQPNQYGEAYFKNRLASHVPNFLAHWTSSGDDNLRDARTSLEFVKRRLPGYAEDLPPRRNVLGEPISPFGGYVPFAGPDTHFARFGTMASPLAFSQQASDDAIVEMANLHHGFSMPSIKMDGVDLTQHTTRSGQSAYDRYLELTGTTRVGGRTLRQRLERLIRSSEYKALPLPFGDESDRHNPRIRAISKLINQHRRLAKKELLKEAPDVVDLMTELRRAGRLGEPRPQNSTFDVLENLFSP